MMQMLQMMMEDREATRAERQANLAALQQIAQNNQGHGNHDHPGSKLKNFQNTNPPMFSKTEEPLDADDWLQTMENNLEVAGVEAAEKVLFATHYLSGPARAWWTSARAMNAGQMMNWEDFKLKFSKYHVPQGLIKKMRDEFRELKQGRMSVVEYRDKFLTLSRYAPDETDTNEKRKERFLNGLHDEMQTVLVNIPFADLEALVDSAIQMEGKLHPANENRKRRMMNQNGPHHTQKYRNNSSGGFTPRHNKPPAQNYRPNYSNNNQGPPKPGGNHNHHSNNNNSNPNNTNNHPNGNNNNPNNAPKTGSNTVPINPKDKSTINCYECGVVGHYSNECPKKLARIAANTAAPAQQQRRFAGRKNQNNNNGRLYHMNAAEAQEAPQAMPTRTTLPNLLYTLPRSCQTPASTFWCVTRAGTGTPRRARNVHAHARARTACVADAPGHVVAPPAPSLPLFSLCARRTTTTPATPWTRLPGRGNPVHHAMADAIRQGTRVHGDDADAPVLQFQRQDARRVHSDVANTAAPPPLTLTYRSHADVDDLPRSTRPPRAAIKGGIPWMISSHLSTPHSLLSPLDLLPLHIAARSRQISRRSPRRC
ncbi:hypothetical protein QYE76_041272 [Lolium multiflorum]|uniref:CCHC-type domain-containing protein n=1 Tax=Lolium multiflorum TaxID=4521 RepID=A0AAD8TD07_LOLMU|nr:hypothetical protein QYE76_041272 [Lolium multiflorum]